MKKYNIKKMILPFLFIGTLTIMSVITFFGGQEEYSENEKRVLAVFPTVSLKGVINGEFQDGLETYISDHLIGREFFVGINAYFSKLLGKNALNDIYSAKDSYLINAPKEQSDKDAVNHFEKNMQNFEKFTALNGIESTLVIVPSAGYVMEDKLPSFHKEYTDQELILKAAASTPSVRFFDARGCLVEAYGEGKQIYYRTDHHLTSQGSYELYKAFCSFNGLEFLPKEEYNITRYEGFYGTTYSGSGYWLTAPDYLEVWDLGEPVKVTFKENGDVHSSMFFTEHLKQKDKYPVYLDGNHGYVKIENTQAKTQKNLLIVRDSYGQNFAPFLAHNYKNIYMLDMRYYRKSVSSLVKDAQIDEILYLFGIDTITGDSSTSYLFF